MRVMELQDWSTKDIRLAERPVPEPGPNDVLLRMKAASLNYRDTVVVQRGYGRKTGELPLVPVSDGAGEVIAVGDQVTEFKAGDLVTPTFTQNWLDGDFPEDIMQGTRGGPLDGTMQEYMVVPETGLVRAPKQMTAVEAATLPCAALTAWHAIVEDGQVGDGDVVVVQGTGGVSLFALQFAKLRGAEVIALSSSQAKLERVQELGADHLINYVETPEWSRTVREITDWRGVSHVIEVGGAGTLEQSVRSVRPGGVVSLIGVLSGATPKFHLGPVVTQNIRLQGVTVGSRAMHQRMVDAIEANGLSPVIDDKRFAFEAVGEALEAFPKGGHFGKLCSEFE